MYTLILSKLNIFIFTTTKLSVWLYKRNIILVIIFLLLFCPFGAFAVSLEGYIKDSLNNQPIETVSVLVYDSTEHFYKGTITNSLGYYHIADVLPGHYIVKTRMLGYKPKVKEVDVFEDNALCSFYLCEKSYDLASVEIVFEPFLYYDEDDNLTINLEQLDNVERMSVADVIETIPGVFFDIEGKLNFAGYDNYTQLIDGKKMGSSYGAMTQDGRQMYLQLKQIPAKYIKKIELFPEPRGRYGYFTPIMNIIPVNDVRTHYEGKLGAGYKNKYDAYASVSTYKGKLMLRPRVYSSSISNYMTQDTWRELYEDTLSSYYRSLDYENQESELGAGLKMYYDFSEREQFTADVSYANNQSKTYNLWDYHYASEDSVGINDDRRSETDKLKLDLAYSKRMDVGISQTLYLTANAQYSNTKNSGDEASLADSLGAEEEKFSSLSQSESCSGVAKAVYYNRLLPVSLLLTTQLESDYENASSWRKFWSDSDQQWAELSAYTNDKSQMTLEPSMDLSLRYRFPTDTKKSNSENRHSLAAQLSGKYYYEKIRDKALDSVMSSQRFYTDWRLRYSAQLGKYNNLKISYSGNNRYPTFSQLYASPVYLDEYNVRMSNSALNPQQSHTFNMTYGWNFSHGRVVVASKKSLESTPKVGFELSLEYHVVKDKITSDYYYIDSVLVHSYTNASAYQSADAALRFRWNMAEHIVYNATLDCSVYEYDELETAFSWSNYFKFNLENNVSFSLKHQYYSDKVEYRYSTKAYHTLSAELSALLFKSTTQVVLDVHNVLTSLGREKESNNSSYNELNISYLETPIIEMKVYFMIFKFYK